MQRMVLVFSAVVLSLAAIHCAADEPKPAVETDSRLHADGKGWRLEKAKITDPARPRVLLIGDSILNGYLKQVVKALDGKAYVDAWVNPYCQSEHLNKLLAEVLDQGPYDVVHFNMGLHGWQEGRIKPGTFEPLTKAYVQVIKDKLPKARIIWASSTPVTVKGKPTELEPAINPVIVEHNRMAASVMAEMDVPVNDFYGLLVDKLEWARGDQFHWTGPGYEVLAKTVTESVLGALAAKKLAPGLTPGPATLVLELSAGEYSRNGTPVVCPLPAAAGNWQAVELRDAATGQRIPVQVDQGPQSQMRWILTDPLEAGQTRRYRLSETSDEAAERPLVRVAGNERGVRVEIEGRPVLQYNAAVVPSEDPQEPAFRRSGFIHPLYDPAGRVVTDAMPPDHMHQHALMNAWVNTTFEGRHVDFWNSGKHEGEVRDAHGNTLEESGPVSGSFAAKLEHAELTPSGGAKTALRETWRVYVYAHADGWLFDIESTQRCAADSPVTINEYHYGGMALRGAREWFQDRPCQFLTSEGKGRKDGNHTRPNWVEMSGDLGDHKSGIVVFCHPDNFRAPQPVRLHPDKPYFCFAPMVLGSFTIEPGKPYVSKYRYFVHTGEPDAKRNEALWHDFADPPVVKIVTP